MDKNFKKVKTKIGSSNDEIKKKIMSKIPILKIVLLVIFIYSGIYYTYKEELTNMDENSTFLDCLYFSSVTTVAVGYGDVTPKTQRTKLIVISHTFFVLLFIFVTSSF